MLLRLRPCRYVRNGAVTYNSRGVCDFLGRDSVATMQMKNRWWRVRRGDEVLVKGRWRPVAATPRFPQLLPLVGEVRLLMNGRQRRVMIHPAAWVKIRRQK